MNYLLNYFILFLPICLFGQNEAYELLSNAILNKNEHEKAMEYLNMAHKLFLLSGNKHGLMEVENVKVDIFLNKSNKQNLYFALKELEKLSSELHNTEKKVKSYKLLFEFFSNLEMYDSALTYAEKLRLLGEQEGLSEDITNFNGYMGSFYLKLKKFEIAKNYFLKSLNFKNKTNQAPLYSEIGNTYYYLNNYDSAYYYYYQAYEQANRFQDTLAIAYTLNNIGLYYKSQKDNRKAIQYFNNAIYFYEILNNRYGVINSNSNIAQTYYNQKKYKEAIDVAEPFFKEAKENEYFILIAELAKVLAESYEKIQQYDKSVIFYKELITSKDTIFQTKLKMLNSDFDYKFKIIEYNSKENSNQSEMNYWQFFCWMGCIIIISLFIYIYDLRKKLSNR